MKEEENIVRFPESQRKREMILHDVEVDDLRVKVCVQLRFMCGWTLFICLLLFMLLHYYLFTPSSLHNIASYAASGLRQHQGDLATITYTEGSFSDAALFNAGLAYSDGDALYIAGPGSDGSIVQQIGYSDPAVESAGDYVLVYDRGGTRALLSRSFSTTGELSLTSNIITGSLASNGYFVLITDEQGYHTACTVYDNQAREVFKWGSSEYYIVSAALSPDCRTLAALTFRQNNMELTSQVLFYDISREDQTPPVAVMQDCLGMELIWLSGSTVAVLADNGLYLAYREGSAEQALYIPQGDLLSFSLSDNCAAVALRSYSGEARCEVYVLRSNGELNGPFPLSEDPLGLAVSRAGFAMLTGSGVSMYRHDFTPQWNNAEAVGAQRLLLTSDGTIVALFAKYAHLFTAHSIQSEEPADADV